MKYLSGGLFRCCCLTAEGINPERDGVDAILEVGDFVYCDVCGERLVVQIIGGELTLVWSPRDSRSSNAALSEPGLAEAAEAKSQQAKAIPPVLAIIFGENDTDTPLSMQFVDRDMIERFCGDCIYHGHRKVIFALLNEKTFDYTVMGTRFIGLVPERYR